MDAENPASQPLAVGAAEQRPVVIPTLTRQKRRVYIALGATLLLLIAFIWAIVLGNGRLGKRGTDDGPGTAAFVIGVVGVTFVGTALVVIFPLVVCMLGCQERDNRRVQESVAQNRADILRMDLAGATVYEHANFVWGPSGLMRRKVMLGFPWIDLLMPFPLYIVIIASDAARAEMAIATACVVLAVSGLRLAIICCICCKHCRRTARLQNEEVVLLSLSEESRVCVVFDDSLRTFRNIGNVPHVAPNGVVQRESEGILGRSQLVPHREDPTNDNSRVIGWSLRVLHASVGKDNQWAVGDTHFPVDPARAHDCHQWLTEPTRRRMFRYEGVAATKADEWSVSSQSLCKPWQSTADVQADADEGAADAGNSLVVRMACTGSRALTASWTPDGDGWFNISLTTLAGTSAAQLRVRSTSTVADFAREVALLPDNNGHKAVVLLPDGRTFAQLDASAKLHDVFAAAVV